MQISVLCLGTKIFFKLRDMILQFFPALTTPIPSNTGIICLVGLDLHFEF